MSQKYNDNTKRPKPKENQPGVIKICVLPESSAGGLEFRSPLTTGDS